MDTVTLINQPAPNFSLFSLEGKLYSLSEHSGSLLILNFWSAECPWAARADEQVLSWMQQWGKRVVMWPIAVNANETLARMRFAARARSLPPVLVDVRQEVADLYGVQTTPHFFLLDEQHVVRYQGALDDVTFRQKTPTRHYLRDAVEAVLEGRLPDPSVTPAFGCAIVRHAP